MRLSLIIASLLFSVNIAFGQSEINGLLKIETGPTESKGLIRVLLDDASSSKVREIVVSKNAKNSYVKISKSVQGLNLDSGSIELNAFVEQFSSLDSSRLEIFVEGVNHKNRSVVSQLIPISELLAGKTNGMIHIVLPYEQKLKRIRVLIRSIGSNEIKLKNLIVNANAGEFGSGWKKNILVKSLNNESLISQLEALARIWGLLKYFGSHISESNINWDMVLVEELRLLWENPALENFDAMVGNLIIKAGLKGIKSNLIKPVKDSSETNRDAINIDYSWIDKCPLLDLSTKRSLKGIVNNYSAFKNKYVTTPEDDERLPSPVFHERKYNKNFLPSMEFRLVSLFRYWNIIQYYYPYKEHIKDHFDGSLKEFIPLFIAANSSKKYGEALIKLNASICDGHSPFPTTSFYLSNYLFNNKISIYPFTVNLDSDGTAIIEKIDSGFQKLTGIHPGDQILNVNDHSLSDIQDTLYSGVGGSREELKNFLISKYRLLSFLPQADDTFRLKIKRDKTEYEKSMRYDYDDIRKYMSFIKEFVLKVRPNILTHDSTHFISKGVLYINPRKFSIKDSAKILRMLRRSKDVIVDCRVYPSGQFLKFASVFLNDSTPYVKYEYAAKYPGLLRSVEVKAKKINSYYYPNNLVLLISNSAISRSELLTMILQARNRRIITVGSNTVGADGDVAIIPMVGEQGMIFRFSGLKVLYPSGLDTHGIGISPDYNFPDKNLLEYTVKAIEANRFIFSDTN